MTPDIEGDGDRWPATPGQSVRVVVLLLNGAGAVVPVSGGAGVDVGEPHRLSGSAVADLLDATVHLSTSDGDPAGLVHEILGLPVPAAFSATAELVGHRALVLRNFQCRVGMRSLRYDRDRGLIEAPGPSAADR